MKKENFLCPHCLCSPTSIQMFCVQESCPQFVVPFTKICIQLHQFCPSHCSWTDYINYYKLYLSTYYNSYYVPILAFYYKYLNDMMNKCQCNQNENVKSENDVKVKKRNHFSDISPKFRKSDSHIYNRNAETNPKCTSKTKSKYQSKRGANCEQNINEKCQCNLDEISQCDITTQCNCNDIQAPGDSFKDCGDHCQIKDSVCYEIIFPKTQKVSYCIKNLKSSILSPGLSEAEKPPFADLNFKGNSDESTKYWVNKLESEVWPSSSSENDFIPNNHRVTCVTIDDNSKKNNYKSIIKLYNNKKICDCQTLDKYTQTDMVSKDLLIEYMKENDKLKNELKKGEICTKCKNIDHKLKFYKLENDILQRELDEVKSKLNGLKNIIKENCESLPTKSDKIIQTAYHCPHLTKICTKETLDFIESKDSLTDFWDNIKMKTDFDTSYDETSAYSKTDWSTITIDSQKSTTKTSKKLHQHKIVNAESGLEISDNFGGSDSSGTNTKYDLEMAPHGRISKGCRCTKACPCYNRKISSSESEEFKSTENIGPNFHLFDEITMTSSQSFEILSSVKTKGNGQIAFPKTDFAIYVYDEDKN